jgi:hypothetical protein
MEILLEDGRPTSILRLVLFPFRESLNPFQLLRATIDLGLEQKSI